MNTAPFAPTDSDVLEAVQREWNRAVSEAVYLPVGFGAHHWRVSAGGAPILFATVDIPSRQRSAGHLENAYASAAAIAGDGCMGIVSPLRSGSGGFTLPIPGGVISVTQWLNGRNPTFAESLQPTHVSKLTGLLRDIHSSSPPRTIPEWTPRIERDFQEAVKERIGTPWLKGPYGEDARRLLTDSIDAIGDSLREYHILAERAWARRNHWVVTHGEPHWANQFLVGDTLYLIDWDTIALAPSEIDAVDLPLSARMALGCDNDLVRMFRLEWHLREISEYAEWFEGEHADTADDRAALDKFRSELGRF